MTTSHEVAKRGVGRRRTEEDRRLLAEFDASFGGEQGPFFSQFGFRSDAWQVMAVALYEHGQQNDVVKTRATGFGPRYEVEGELVAPDGRRPRVRKVWQVDAGEVAPRLSSAYPLEAQA